METVSDATFFEQDCADRLCAACQSLFEFGSQGEPPTPYSTIEDDYLPHHDSSTSLQEAISDGCYLCVTVEADRAEAVMKASRGIFYYQYGLLFLEIDLCILGPDGDWRWRVSSHFNLSDVDDHASLYRISHTSLKQQHMGATNTTPLVQRWLKTCLSNQHEQCGSKLSDLPKSFPTRLLDVSGGKVRLIETAEQFEPAPFATMSYRWGDKPFLQLSNSNLEDFKTEIPLADMAKSFRDIVNLIRELNIRYLWLDCFCIIQSGSGAEIDWQKESVEMSTIYSNAVLNIGAAHGNDAHSGCYSARQRQIKPLLCSFWRTRPNVAPRLYHVYPMYGITRYLELYAQGIIFTRAWVFQERILCSRMLYFASDQLYWECSGSGSGSGSGSVSRRMLACEEFPAGMRSDIQKVDLVPWTLQPLNPPLRNGQQDLLRLWAALVRHYSDLSLTCAHEDKFLAMAGIAQRMSEIMNDQYVAGMFKQNLITQLQWVAGHSSKRPLSWRAPSWSWASIDGHVEMSYYVFNDLATILSFDLKHAQAGNPYGPLHSGSLQLLCRPIPCEIMPKQGHEMFLDVADEPVPWHPDDESELANTTPELVVVFTAISGTDYASDRSSQSISLEELLPLAKDLKSAREFRLTAHLHGIVLRKLDQSRYVRIGALGPSECTNHFALWYRIKERTITVE